MRRRGPSACARCTPTSPAAGSSRTRRAPMAEPVAVRRAVVFDLDGTLADTTPDIAAAINRTLAARGLGPLSDEAVHSFTGYGAGELVRRAFAAAGMELDDDEAAAETRRYLEA